VRIDNEVSFAFKVFNYKFVLCIRVLLLVEKLRAIANVD
jgi:hypothetical protein